ncbi:DotI/IcmL family type IV secretion protein [Vibrio breoganii]
MKPQKKKPNRQSLVIERREFYKEARRSLVILAVCSIVTLTIAVVAGIFTNNNTSKNVYFSIHDDGRLVNMQPFDQPNLRDNIIIGWVQRALVDTFDFNFHNLNHALSKSSATWFTEEGGRELIKALESEGHFDTIRSQRLILTYAPTHNPIIVRKFLNPSTGRYTWHLQSQGKLTYINANGRQHTENTVFNIEVERRSLREDATGIGISKLIMTYR